MRIRTRAPLDAVFKRQLALNDLLDTAIGMLPGDAYAFLMLVDHDLFEDDDDDFACGRAYGGSRVAVVSTARYNPELDSLQSVERQHAWPASHCEAYLQSCCVTPSKSRPQPKKMKVPSEEMSFDLEMRHSHPSLSPEDLGPLQAAVSAYNTTPPSEAPTPGIWLSRVCRTASHEVGHCFGMGHCVYYACVMQGTAGLSEDVRQPPYLCPVDLAKVLQASSGDPEQRYAALLSFSERHKHNQMFAAFAAWLRARVES